MLCRESLDEFVPLLMLFMRLEGFLPVVIVGQEKVVGLLGNPHAYGGASFA